MADEEKDDAEQEASAPKGKKPMLLIGIIGGMVLLTAVAAIIVFKVLLAPPKEDVAEPEKEVAKEAFFGKLFSFEEPIIVNLADTKGQRYLKVNIQFEVSDDKVIEELKKRTPLMLDLLIGILSGKTIEDVENTMGRNRLRREIIDKSNAELVSGKVINVYFTEFVIQ